MYPDDLPDPKPAVGEELNKPAIIFMDGFWPKDKTTGDLIQDPQRLEGMNYTSRLQRIVAKTGGTFMEYKPETGTCIFQVTVNAFVLPPLPRMDDYPPPPLLMLTPLLALVIKSPQPCAYEINV